MKLGFVDEPPGKLRAVQLRCHDQDVVLVVTYHPDLFSDRREWPEAIVGAQPIERVFWSRGEYERQMP